MPWRRHDDGMSTAAASEPDQASTQKYSENTTRTFTAPTARNSTNRRSYLNAQQSLQRPCLRSRGRVCEALAALIPTADAWRPTSLTESSGLQVPCPTSEPFRVLLLVARRRCHSRGHCCHLRRRHNHQHQHRVLQFAHSLLLKESVSSSSPSSSLVLSSSSTSLQLPSSPHLASSLSTQLRRRCRAAAQDKLLVRWLVACCWLVAGCRQIGCLARCSRLVSRQSGQLLPSFAFAA